MPISLALSRRPLISKCQTPSVPFSKRHLFRWPSRRFQCSQAAIAPRSKSVPEADSSHLNDVLCLLKTKQIPWNSQEAAEFDFRSDVVTTPSLAILRAIIETTLLDDVYREDQTTLALERQMARITGHESAMFVVSGTMGNQVALRTHLVAPPHAVLCDARSHIVHWESGGLGLSSAMIQAVLPSNREFLTLEDIQRKAELSDDVLKCPTTVVSLENTISGLIHPLSEVQRISTWARASGLKLHLDGARLWEAVAADAGSLRDYAQYFDSVALDFSKGLGAPMGAIIVGNGHFIQRARRIRQAFGGGMRQCGILSAPARAVVEEFIDAIPLAGRQRIIGEKLRKSHIMARRATGMWVHRGGKLKRRTETNLVWIDLGGTGKSEDEFIELGRKYGVRLGGSRIVLHYQISEEALRRLGLVFDRILAAQVEG